MENTDMKQVNIFYQCDDKFAFMVGTSLTSLLANASTKIYYRIYFIAAGLSKDNIAKFQSLKNMFPKIHYDLIFLDTAFCEAEVKKWKVPDHRGSYVTYYKLCIDHYMKEESIDRIMHIGADTLVTGTLEGLADYDFGGAPFAMNWSERLFHCHFRLHYRYAIAEMVYFNLPVWRKVRGEERCRRFARKYGSKYDSKDQDILNMEFQFEYAQLPLKYNVYASTLDFSDKHKRKFNSAKVISNEEIADAYAHPEIIHIPKTFLYRPHEIGSLDPTKDMWWKYLKMSPWNGMESVEVTSEGVKERFLRWVWIHTSKNFREWFYIASRKYYGLMRAVIQLPYQKSKERIGRGTGCG